MFVRQLAPVCCAQAPKNNNDHKKHAGLCTMKRCVRLPHLWRQLVSLFELNKNTTHVQAQKHTWHICTWEIGPLVKWLGIEGYTKELFWCSCYLQRRLHRLPTVTS